MSGPRIGELFAGYGGLGMGVQAVYGGSIAWVSEFDKGPSKILAHRFPGVPNHGDITTIDWSQVEPVDILTGGSPCQDLSHAGKRGGMTQGTRSNLWVAMREAIAQLRPTTVIWENVRGAFSASADSAVEPCPGCVGDGSGVHLRALGRVLGDLSDLGYDAQWHGLRAADVGAPHGRFRVFVVATDTRNGAGHGEWARSESRQGDQAASIATDLGHERARRARDGRAGSQDGNSGLVVRTPNPYELHLSDMCFEGATPVSTLLPTPTTRDHKDGQIRMEPHRPDDMDTLSRALTVTLLPTPRASDGEKGGPNQRGSSGDLMLPAAVQPGRLLPTPTTADSKASGSAGYNGNEFCTLTDSTVRQPEKWGDYAAAIARWERVIGRPAPEPTILSKKGSPQLSPVFVEWMMGLPAGWVTDVPGITRNEALKALGNGVVPQQCAAALRTMLAGEVAA